MKIKWTQFLVERICNKVSVNQMDVANEEDEGKKYQFASQPISPTKDAHNRDAKPNKEKSPDQPEKAVSPKIILKAERNKPVIQPLPQFLN